MVLIDTNAYVGNWPYKQMAYSTCESLLKKMNQFGVDKAVVANMSGIFYKNCQAANEALFAEIESSATYKERIIPFAIINPFYPGWKSDFDKCVKVGIKGIRIYPQYHDYQLTDSACVELVKMARDHDLVVGLTMRMVDSRQKSWMDLDQLAGTDKPEQGLVDLLPIIKEVPAAKYFILNLANGYQLKNDDFELIMKSKVLMDTSGRSLANMAQALEFYGEDKFAFGTHAPILDYLTGMLRIESLREEEASQSTKDLLRWRNAQSMLNL
ncbi:Amidohydrolase 2 [Cyclobacterium amurskyense]|uniref:Amidohydrolase 2 n=2 Tax=Cyclobacterium amurskyense TaxID=320787 RepID=A0A0H4P672_9BACT|nr:Amidohydrolase 2 [Cyclobacterium amurskyense]